MQAPRRQSGVRFLENLAYLVPGYEGYKRRELRQEEDARLRARVYRQLLAMRTQLDAVRERWTGDASGPHMEQLTQCQLRIQTIADAVRFAPYGFKSFFDAEPVDERLLDRLLESDLLILEDLDATLFHLEQNSGSVTTAPRTSRIFFRALNEMVGRLEGHLIIREKILASA